MKTTSKQFDLVVYGATGFTGQLVAEYLANRKLTLRWAIAGRDESKLERVAAAIGQPDLPILIADAQDFSAIDRLVEKTKLVISTAGPYILYGMPLAAACAKSGVDYVNISGEPTWAFELIRDYQKAAQESGSRVVISAGMDSIPFELGVVELQRHALRRFGKPIQHVSTRVLKYVGEFSGGSVAAGRLTRELARHENTRRILLDPFALTNGHGGVTQPLMHKVRQDEETGEWLAPFVMSPINSKNIHLSNYLLKHVFGKDFVYDEMASAGYGPEGRIRAEEIAQASLTDSQNEREPGEGPSREKQERGCLKLCVFGKSDSGERLAVNVSCDVDPGYLGTSKMVSETAILLLDQPNKPEGGVWVPGAALGVDLVERLTRYAGMSFELESD